MKKTREKWTPEHVAFVGGLLMCIGVLLDNNGGVDFFDTFRVTLICVGSWMVTWWLERKRPALLTKMSKKRLRFCRITAHVCSWGSVVLVIFVFCYAVYQM